MAEIQEPQVPQVPAQMKKACQISLMFPVETDEEALAVKKAIDDVLPVVDHKRYTFQITEM